MAAPLFLGRIVVPAAGTPVQLSASLAGVLGAQQAKFLKYHALLIQVWYANTGKIYIGAADMVKGTGSKVGVTLPLPSSTSIPAHGMTDVLSPAGISLDDVWIDADVNGDSVTVTLLET